MSDTKKFLNKPGAVYMIGKIKALLGLKADADLSNVDASVFLEKAQAAGAAGTPIVAAASTDGVSYTATVDGVTELTVGLTLIIIPDVVSTNVNVKLNVNGLGDKYLRLLTGYNTTTTTTAAVASWLAKGKPVQVRYNGTYWITDLQRASANALSGVVKIENGGTGASTAEEALANLGGIAAGAIGNLHVWEHTDQDDNATYLTSAERNAYPDDAIDGTPAGYELVDEMTNIQIYQCSYSSSDELYFTRSSTNSVTVSDDGTVALDSAISDTTVAYGSSNDDHNNLIGHFFRRGNKASNVTTPLEEGVIYYCPPDATVTRTSTTVTLSKLYKVQGYAEVYNGWFTYLGQLGAGCAKIEVVSYVGTGTNGSANPTSVTADFPIKVVEVLEVDGVQPLSPTSSSSKVKLTMNALTLTTSYVEGAGLTPSGTSKFSSGKRSEDGKTFSWYNTSGAKYQFNDSGSVYAILIIG